VYRGRLDKDDSCPTADRSNIGRPNGPAYLTGELLNTPRLSVLFPHMFAVNHPLIFQRIDIVTVLVLRSPDDIQIEASLIS